MTEDDAERIRLIDRILAHTSLETLRKMADETEVIARLENGPSQTRIIGGLLDEEINHRTDITTLQIDVKTLMKNVEDIITLLAKPYNPDAYITIENLKNSRNIF